LEKSKDKMNKQEKFISLILAALLIGWFVWSYKKAVDAPKEIPTAPIAQEAVEAKTPEASKPQVAESKAEVKKVVPNKPEKTVVLKNDNVIVEFSTWGAVAKSATMLKYATNPGEISEKNPAVKFDFSTSPAFRLEGVKDLAPDADYQIVAQTSNSVTFSNEILTRTFTLCDDYVITLNEKFSALSTAEVANKISLGALKMGSSKNDILSIDSWKASIEGGAVEHHGETDPLKSYLVSGAGGCSGTPDATGFPKSTSMDIPGARKWVAVKSRFFTTALAESSQANSGFTATISRDASKSAYALESIEAPVSFPSIEKERNFKFFVGPKKQSILWDLGMKDVMEFGMWRWVCYPTVWLLNTFNNFIPNFGIAILILTIFVRILFWPLTHKSTISMRRMQEIQPKMKEIREKFKDNPQRMQQETFQLYREHNVNPMSSCLPMLIQIPVFIALFTVLRSAVELRYAPFLWIVDLSEPENLFPTIFPFGGLNILPILMAVTMGLQSALTPSTGDKNQQRMMTVMMPVMMLFMFYSFPSALSLYWTVSQILSIAQMWWIRKKYNPQASNIIGPDAVEMPQTRQMRRHPRA
jgi:YidC/Oxa1 family membrane protein insertase